MAEEKSREAMLVSLVFDVSNSFLPVCFHAPSASSFCGCALMWKCTFLLHFPPHFPSPPLITPSLFVLQEFTTSGSSNTDTGKSGGHLENKYKVNELGLNFTQKWNTDNTLTTEITIEDQVESNKQIISRFMYLKNI